MKKYLCISLLFVAVAAFAQTPTPTPSATPAPLGSIYGDTSKKAADRIADATAYLADLNNSSDPDPAQIEDVAYMLDWLQLTNGHHWADLQDLAETLIGNNGAYYTGPATPHFTQIKQDNLFSIAVFKKAQLAFHTGADRIAFLLGVFTALPDTASDALVAAINDAYLHALQAQVDDFIKAADYTNALAFALQPQLLSNYSTCGATMHTVLAIKTLTHADDVLSWAKVVYTLGRFSDSKANSVAVANAFRAAPGMGIAVANQFIASQTDATITNPLTAVPFPAMLTTGPLPEPGYAGLNILLRGDSKNALAYARAQYDTAATNGVLNKDAAAVASALRNFYGNLIRANQFVASVKPVAAGQPTPAPFVFTELQ